MARRARKSGSKKPRSRLLASPKVSDYQVEKIVRLFAAGESAAAAHRQMALSYVSVRRLYELIRRRMIEVGLFAPEENAVSFALAEDDEDAHDDDLAAIRPALGQRRGVRARTKPDHIAELLFRLGDDRLLPKSTPADRARAHAQLHADMMRIIRLTGPLNRPADPAALLRGRAYVVERFAAVRLRAIEAAFPSWGTQARSAAEALEPPPGSLLDEPIEEWPAREPLGRIPKRPPEGDPPDQD